MSGFQSFFEEFLLVFFVFDSAPLADSRRQVFLQDLGHLNVCRLVVQVVHLVSKDLPCSISWTFVAILNSVYLFYVSYFQNCSNMFYVISLPSLSWLRCHPGVAEQVNALVATTGPLWPYFVLLIQAGHVVNRRFFAIRVVPGKCAAISHFSWDEFFG